MDKAKGTTFSFARSERLKSQKVIGELFKGGQNSFVAYPLRIVWKPMDAQWLAHPDAQVQVMISVPKRTFKTAVQRNRLKRQIREAYRLNKSALLEKINPEQFPIALMLMYVAKEALPFLEIEAGVKKMIRKWPGV